METATGEQLTNTEQQATLRAFSRALTREAHVLAHRPDLLWQQLYNRLQQEDLTAQTLAPELERRSAPGAAPWMQLRSLETESQALLRTLKSNTGWVWDCAFSPDGALLFSGSSRTITQWDVATGHERQSFPINGSQLTLSPDGATIVTSSEEQIEIWDAWLGQPRPKMHRMIQIWDTASCQLRHKMQGYVADARYVDFPCAFSPDGKTFVMGGPDGVLQVWDAETGQRRATIAEPTPVMLACVFSVDGKLVFGADSNNRVLQWDVAFRLPVRFHRSRWFDDPRPITACAFSADGSMFASADREQTIRVWGLGDSQDRGVFVGHRDRVTVCLFSRDGRTLASVSADGVLKLWDVEGHRERSSVRGHTGAVAACAISPDGSTLLSGGEDGTVKLWDVMTGDERSALTDLPGQVRACAFSPDGTTVALGGEDGSVIISSSRTPRERNRWMCHQGKLTVCAFSPDGTILLSGDEHGALTLWDPRTGEERATLHGHTGAINAGTFSPDGRIAVSASEDGTVKAWEVSTGQERSSLAGYADGIVFCAYGPDGRTILSGGHSGVLTMWDATSGRKVVSWASPEAEQRCDFETCTLSPDGMAIACGCFWRFRGWHGNQVVLKDVATGQERWATEGHRDHITRCAFSKDGALIATASQDHTLRLWDAVTGRELATLRGHSSTVRACAFSPNGALVASGDEAGMIKLWDVHRALRGEHHPELGIASGHCTAGAFSLDGARLLVALGEWGNGLKELDTVTGEELRVLLPDMASDSIKRCVYSPDGTRILTVSGNMIALLDSRSGQQTRSAYTDHLGDIAAFCVSPDGTMLATGAQDGYLVLWDTETLEPRDGYLVLWDTETLRPLGRFVVIPPPLGPSVVVPGYDLGIKSCAFSPDGAKILVGGLKWLALWELATRDLLFTLHDFPAQIADCGFSPDGTTILTLHDYGVVKLWDVTRGQARLSFAVPAVIACNFTPDGERIVTVGNDGGLRLWDARTGHEVALLPLPDTLTFLTLHPFIPCVLTGGSAGAPHLVDVRGVIYGPIVTTAVDRGGGPVVHCHVCGREIALGQSQLGTVIDCVRPGCTGRMRVNLFVIQMPGSRSEHASSAPPSARPPRRIGRFWPFSRRP